jgi:hypothetical protein
MKGAFHMKLLIALFASIFLASPILASSDTTNATVGGKTYQVRVPKSAQIDCTKEENKEKLECKKESRTIPKIEKPKETAPVGR